MHRGMSPFLRPCLSWLLTYLNYLISKAPPSPKEKGAKSKDEVKDSTFVAVSRVAILLSQTALILASISETLLVLCSESSSIHPGPLVCNVTQILPHASFSSGHILIPQSSWLAWTVGTFGCLLRYISIRSLGNLFTYQLSIRKDHQLITTGPYSIVRHPGYSGSIISAIGTGWYFLGKGSYVYEFDAVKTPIGFTFAGVWLAWKLYMAFNVVRRTESEDRFLKAEFGEVWIEWASRVKYRLIPGVV